MPLIIGKNLRILKIIADHTDLLLKSTLMLNQTRFHKKKLDFINSFDGN